MKKRMLTVVGVLLCSMVLVMVLSSCDNPPIPSKALIVVNNSASPITYVSIKQYVSGSRTGAPPNALAVEETIAVGESKTFYLAPYAADWIDLTIKNEDLNFNLDSIELKYEYLIDGSNEPITATFTTQDERSTITLTGSGVTYQRIC